MLLYQALPAAPDPSTPNALRECRLSGGETRIRDRKVSLDGFAGNAAHDVNAELQAHSVDRLSQRFEPSAIGSGREAISGRDAAAKGIHGYSLGILHSHTVRQRVVPAEIHHDGSPAERLKMLLEPGGVGESLCFRH